MKKITSAFFAVSVSAVLLGGCSSPDSPPPPPTVAPKNLTGPSVSIMSYNVENLFDTTHDEGKDDVTFLPLALKQSDPKLMQMCENMTTDSYKRECRETDWNDAVLGVKLARLGQAIRQIDGGLGPDILLMAEVENKNVLEMLRTKELANSNYVTSVLIEGDDERGIDTALLSRFKEWAPAVLHRIPFQGKDAQETANARRTRGILEAKLLLDDGTKLSVFVVHLPSQSHPSWVREQAIEYLNQLQKQVPAGVLAIAGGDFNVSKSEDQKTGFVSKTLASQWQVSHLVGCRGCQGTEVYKKEWSFLDILLFSPSMRPGGSANWVLDPATIRIPHDVREQTNKFGEPNRFSPDTGVSDHWPMFARIVQVAPAPAQK